MSLLPDQCFNCGKRGTVLAGPLYACHDCDTRWNARLFNVYDQRIAAAHAELVALNGAREWKVTLIDHSREHVPSPG
jgi:hypothetical protein